MNESKLNFTLMTSISQVVEDGYEFFARRQLVTLFSAPNYCGDYDNAGGMMTVNEDLMCSFQVKQNSCTLLQLLYSTHGNVSFIGIS